ncbi:hypothetical protein FACS189483_09250 [Spirochaetia bacterium]|nr:hypothetical protein FACS189483_09250 [Spirochaetia bacterium]
MTSKLTKAIIAPGFIAAAVVIGILVVSPERFFRPAGRRVQKQTRIVIPQALASDDPAPDSAERMAWGDSMNAKIVLDDGEALVDVLTQDLDGDQIDEQIIAYRNLIEQNSPIYITYVDYDPLIGGYTRLWSDRTAASRPGTITVYTQDLIGDRSICVIVTGINAEGEHTLTLFKLGGEESYTKIAEITIDGSIIIQEAERTQAYQLGLTRGASFAISARGRDNDSTNMLDQVEITYTYNDESEQYEQGTITRLPGSQVEQQRVRELLAGGSRNFEEFVSGLWYYVSPQGTLDNRQYIYFDPLSRELIFYGDETQQVFIWQNSSATRYGIYISSQNISVTTLRRSVTIELESLDRIRVRVVEDVRLKVLVSNSWDGSYRRAGTVVEQRAEETAVVPYVRASYDGSIGKLVFYPDGSYALFTDETVQQGKYSFFLLEDRELLELRPGGIGTSRETYLVDRQTEDELNLVRIRMSTRGIQEAHEAAISLTRIGGDGAGETTQSGS